MSTSHSLDLGLPGADVAEPFLKRVRIRNYKSIKTSDIDLGRLTMLVGRNGSGKSNFLDALRFVVDALQGSLDHAITSRGGIEAVRRRSTGHPHNFSLDLEMNLPGWRTGRYRFEIGSQKGGGFTVKKEALCIVRPSGEVDARYQLEDGQLRSQSVVTMPPSTSDRLYLVNAAGLPDFRPIYDALLAMGFYNLNPEAMKDLQSPNAGELLQRDGRNIASVIGRLSVDQPLIMQRVGKYLSSIVPGVVDVARESLGPKETLLFRQEVVGSNHPWRFYAASMSDGTLRVLGILIAVTQLAEKKGRVTLVGIEEPETALHPAAAGALMDALREAASYTQVLVTSHSPDFLDQIDPNADTLLAVQSKQGDTEIGPVDPASQKAIRNHLYTAGELLRMDQLEIDPRDLQRQEQATFEFAEGM